jgi:hypothetical protein
MRDPTLDVATLHQLARKARESMSPDQIAHAARIARANMRLTAKLKEQFRQRCREEAGDVAEELRPARLHLIAADAAPGFYDYESEELEWQRALAGACRARS